MAKITITFHEEGQAPVAFEIPAEAAEKLDRYVTDSNGVYAGKADLFLKHNVTTLLSPIIDKYPNIDIETKKKQIAKLAAEIEAEKLAVVVPVPVIQVSSSGALE